MIDCHRLRFPPAWAALLPVAFAMLLANGNLLAQSWPKLDFQIESFPGAYRIKISTTGGGAVKSDVILNAAVTSSGYRTAKTVVSQKFTLKAGQKSTVLELPYLLNMNSWQNNRVIIERDENCRYDPGDYLITSLSPNGWIDDHTHQMLYVSSNIASIASQTITADPKKQSAPFSYGLGVTDPAKVPTFAKLLPAYENNGQISASTVQGDLSMLQAAQESIDQIKAVPTDGFFRDWTCMISVQTVLINSADLDLLSKIPEQLMTLRKWVFAGGQLVVLDAGENFGKRGKILNKLLGQPVRQAEWFQPSDEMKAVKGFAVRNAWNMQTGANQVTSITDLPLKPRLPCKSFENQDLIMTPIMQGKLILANSDMTKGTSKQWQLLHNWLRSDDTITSLVGHNCHKGAFQQAFRIPGIGNPPVLAFQLLIGLYVLVIGPALYFFLNSTGRLYLLLVTIPLFSLGAVATLFTYGIVSDGFSTRGRLQSVSYVDQKLQTAVTHSRYVYYSGVRPSANRFPADAFASNSRSTSSGSCRVVRAKDQQLLSGGHIKARSPFQLTSLQSSTCESRLMFSPNQTGASGLISNAYPNRILFAIVYTQDGWYTASDIDSGASKDAQKTEYRNVKSTLNKYLTKIKVDPYYLSGRFRSRYEIQNDHDNWGMSNDVISGLRSGYLQGELMPENSYLLVLESNELMSNPQPTADLGENQLHVVLGKW